MFYMSSKKKKKKKNGVILPSGFFFFVFRGNEEGVNAEITIQQYKEQQFLFLELLKPLIKLKCNYLLALAL